MQPQVQPMLNPPTRAAIFLVLVVHPGADAEDVVRELLADVPGLSRSVGFRVPAGELACVVGIGAQLYDRLFAGPRPGGLHPLRPIAGERHTAVSTPGDLLFHLRAQRMDLCFELAGLLMDRLRGVASAVDETHGFKYFDERDLMGFVDGTENPVGPDAVAATVIGDEDPRFTGGSYVIVQKYLHDLDAWNALPVAEQERVIGRTKLSNVELPDEVQPADSHVALTTIVDEDGTERQIVRDNMPFGRVGAGEFGTYFIGYSATPSVTERMLENMFVGDPPGTTDRILEFSTAVTGSLFFVPSADFLDELPDPAGARAPDSEPSAEPAGVPVDDSLGIGSLRRETPSGHQ